MSILKSIKNGMLTSTAFSPVRQNTPSKAQPRYSKYSTEASAYYARKSVYASNVFDAEIQGLNYSNFYEWSRVTIRSSNVFEASTGENGLTSWQKILIISRKVDFIPVGAYVKYNGATWLVVNPDNVASPTGDAIVVRCNTTYNTLDFYGNLIKTPMFYPKGSILAGSPYYMNYSATLDGYQHVFIQLNDATKSITNNTRCILGKSAFAFYGVVDFSEEFTDDAESIHLLRSDLRLQETIEADDLVTHVADGKYFSFKIDVGGKDVMHVGETQQLDAVSIRNGAVVYDSQENPISYLLTTSDSSIAEVDANGRITAIGAGKCTITCSLVQNVEITEQFELSVEERAELSYIDFITPIPETVQAFSAFSVEAAYYENGVKTDADIQYSVTGAVESAYTIIENGNVLTIDTWHAAEAPLYIVASYNGIETKAEVKIEGY